ncbi:MAG: ROK family protein [Gemmatimonadota bacterium]
MLRLGVDLGGTKLEVVALDPDGQERLRRRVATPRGDYEATVAAITRLVTAAEAELGATGTVGLGIPGTLSTRHGGVKNANSTWLLGRPLKADLEARLERPIRLMNDANCFALSEAVDGAGAGAQVVFGVILGTGVGGGIVVDGRVVEGAQGIAGEWGHTPLPWPEDDERPGPTCYCGRRGCLETVLSGPGFAADYERQSGRKAKPEEIVERAAMEEAHATEALFRYRNRLARGLAAVINILDPHVVVLGGGMSNLPRLTEGFGDTLSPWVFNDEVRTKVVLNHHGDSSGVRGAAWLWPLPGSSGP